MKVTRQALTLGAAMIACPALAGVAEAQSRKAPRINLTTALGSSVASNYVEPSVTLSEDAYVFVISVDVDRHVQVLHPDETGLSVKMVARRELHLPRFFAGFGAGDSYSRAMGVGYSAYDYGSGYSDTRGTMIALASRRPFDLSSISSGGQWDQTALQRLVADREPYSAASLLAKYLGAPGEPIGRDVHRFAGGRHFYNAFYGGSAYDYCGFYSGGLGYARGFRPGYSISFFRAAQLAEAGYVVRFRGYDACGQPHFDVYPQAIVGNPAVGRPPAVGEFPSGRLPSTTPRNPTGERTADGMTGARPTPGRFTEREASPTPPTRRVPDGGTVFARPRPQPEASTVSERPQAPPVARPVPRAEAERPAPRHSPSPPAHVSAPRHVPAQAAPVRTPPPPQPERTSPPPRTEATKPTPTPARSDS